MILKNHKKDFCQHLVISRLIWVSQLLVLMMSKHSIQYYSIKLFLSPVNMMLFTLIIFKVVFCELLRFALMGFSPSSRRVITQCDILFVAMLTVENQNVAIY